MKIEKGLIFIGGAIAGSLTTYLITSKKLDKKYKEHYMGIAEDSINSIKEHYKQKTEELAEINRVKPDISSVVEEKIGEVPIEANSTYQSALNDIQTNIFEPSYHEIDETEYVDTNGFEKETLTYYRDGVLANDYDEVITIEPTVGLEAVEKVVNMKDTVYIRNESTVTDYQIDYSDKTFFEVSGKYVKELDE